jgi:hypothetical protein
MSPHPSKHLFDLVEVWAIGRQQPHAGGGECLPYRCDLARAKVTLSLLCFKAMRLLFAAIFAWAARKLWTRWLRGDAAPDGAAIRPPPTRGVRMAHIRSRSAADGKARHRVLGSLFEK